MKADNVLRHVRLSLAGYTLLTWDTHKRRDGRTVIGYRFTGPDGVLFHGTDFCPSPMHADDADATLYGLLGFLLLRPGDTDCEYFEQYTPEQMAFAQSGECEYLQCRYMSDDSEAEWRDGFEDLP